MKWATIHQTQGAILRRRNHRPQGGRWIDHPEGEALVEDPLGHQYDPPHASHASRKLQVLKERLARRSGHGTVSLEHGVGFDAGDDPKRSLGGNDLCHEPDLDSLQPLFVLIEDYAKASFGI